MDLGLCAGSKAICIVEAFPVRNTSLTASESRPPSQYTVTTCLRYPVDADQMLEEGRVRCFVCRRSHIDTDTVARGAGSTLAAPQSPHLPAPSPTCFLFLIQALHLLPAGGSMPQLNPQLKGADSQMFQPPLLDSP